MEDCVGTWMEKKVMEANDISLINCSNYFCRHGLTFHVLLMTMLLVSVNLRVIRRLMLEVSIL